MLGGQEGYKGLEVCFDVKVFFKNVHVYMLNFSQAQLSANTLFSIRVYYFLVSLIACEA